MYAIKAEIIGYQVTGGGWSERGVGAIQMYSLKEAKNAIKEFALIYPNIKMEAVEEKGIRI